MAFCKFIIIFINLLAVHFYGLVLNWIPGTLCFVFQRHGQNLTVNSYYYDVSQSPRPTVWKWHEMSLFEMVASVWNALWERLKEQKYLLGNVTQILKHTSKFFRYRKQTQDYKCMTKVTFSSISNV